MPFQIDAVKTKYLFMLVGGNTLPNYVAACLLTCPEAVIYLVHSEETSDQRQALEKVLKQGQQSASCWPAERTAPAQAEHMAQIMQQLAQCEIINVPTQAANPSSIFTSITGRLKSIPDSATVGLHYTGGTKVMAVHAFRALQDWQCENPRNRRVCSTYLDAGTLHLWAERSDWRGAQSQYVGDLVDVSLCDLLALHRRDELKKPVRTAAIWPSVVQALMEINNKEELRKKWVTPWKTYKQFEEKNELKLQEALKDVRTDQLHLDSHWFATIYTHLSQETRLKFPTTFGNIVQASPFAQTPSPFYEMVKWFTGGWFEDYVFLHIQQFADRIHMHDLTLNVQPKLGNKDFEFDVVAIRHYQLFAFSCTLDRGRKECKHKLLEAVARARQLGGSEARIALVCCYEDARDLQNEVDALVRDNQARVFARDDLPNLRNAIEQWMKSLDLLTRKP